MTVLRSVRRLATVVSVLALLGLVAGPGGALADEVRTDPGDVAGFRVRAVATPLTVRVFENTVPIPADPGEPNVEVSVGYAAANLDAGPRSRAVSSLAWPGPAVGDGMSTFVEMFGGPADFDYPVRAVAEYPGGEAEDELALPTGAGMQATAAGLDVAAVTEFSGELVPLLLRTGTMRTQATSTAEDGIARAAAESVLSQVELLGGLVRLDELRTSLVATSDGEVAEASGGTEVVGLSVAGTRFAVGRDGVVTETEDEDSPLAGRPPLPLALLGVLDLRELVGVQVEVAPVEERGDDEAAAAGRTAGGLTITIDQTRLFQVLNQLPVHDLLGLLPEEAQRQLLPLLGLSPQVELTIGRAVVDASASPVLSFDPPPLPPPPSDDPGELPPLDEGPPLDVGDDLGAPAALGDAPALEDPAVAAPVTPEEPEVAVPAASAGDPPDFFGGLPAGVLLLSAVAVALAARGLERLTGVVFAGAPAGPVCTGGHGAVPDLRALAGR